MSWRPSGTKKTRGITYLKHTEKSRDFVAKTQALALGYQLKIFDVMADLDKPVSCMELARAAALHPRYVQEWLGIMCTGRIIEIRENADGDTTYFLPPEHGALLTRKAGSGNMGVYTQEIPLLTQIAMARVTDDFAAGNKIPYAAYPRFQAFMAQLSHAKHRHMLAQGGLFSMVDIDAASLLSGNMDHPMGPFLYTVSLMHCMPVGLSDQGRGMGMMWGREQAVSLLRQAGFEKIQVIEMDHDPFNVHYLCRV
ncbi:MAG: hypothetical protein ACNA7H_06700 [Desulfotignum sp.]